MKGQYLTLQQMVLFTLGVVLLMIVFYSFDSTRERVRLASRENQLGEVGTYVLSGLWKAYWGGANTTLSLPLPERVLGSEYRIAAEADSLRIGFLEEESDILVSLEGLQEGLPVVGYLASSAGRIRVERLAEKIVIGR